MDRVIAPNSVNLAGADGPPGSGTAQYFTSGNPGLGIPATILPGYQMNAIQEEIYNVITAGGITPSKSTLNQMAAAITKLSQAQSGNNAAVAGGAVDAWTFSLTPTLLARVPGMPIRIQFPNSATGAAATINDGLGAVALTRPFAQQLWQGDVGPSYWYTIIWDGTEYIIADLYDAAINARGTISTNQAVVNGGSATKIGDLSRIGGRKALIAVHAQNASAGNWNGLILAQQFSSTLTVSCVSQQNVPGTITLSMSSSDIMLQVSGGAGNLTCSCQSIGSF